MTGIGTEIDDRSNPSNNGEVNQVLEEMMLWPIFCGIVSSPLLHSTYLRPQASVISAHNLLIHVLINKLVDVLKCTMQYYKPIFSGSHSKLFRHTHFMNWCLGPVFAVFERVCLFCLLVYWLFLPFNVLLTLLWAPQPNYVSEMSTNLCIF